MLSSNPYHDSDESAKSGEIVFQTHFVLCYGKNFTGNCEAGEIIAIKSDSLMVIFAE